MIPKKEKYMQKKSFLRLLLGTAGYALLGNILALIVTFSLGNFGVGNALMGLAAFCSLSLYFMMVFNAAHKDGETDRKLFNRKTIEKPEGSKWVKIGIIVWLLLCIPCVVLIIVPGFLIVVRFLLASIMAVSFLLSDAETPALNPSWAPFLFMGIFALTPVVCRLGYWVAFYEKWSVDNIVYKKKK